MFTSFEKCSHGAFEDRQAWDPSHWLWVKKKHLPIWSESLQPLEKDMETRSSILAWEIP